MVKHLVFILVIDRSEEGYWVDTYYYEEIISKIKEYESIHDYKDVDIHVSVFQFNDKLCLIDNSLYNLCPFGDTYEYIQNFNFRKCEGEARWAFVFSELNKSMVPYDEPEDIGVLQSNFNSCKPIILFVSCSKPVDDFEESLNHLRCNPWYNMAHKYFIDINGDNESCIPQEFTLYSGELDEFDSILSYEDCPLVPFEYDPYDPLWDNDKKNKYQLQNATPNIDSLFTIEGVTIGKTSIVELEEKGVYVNTAFYERMNYPLRKGCEINNTDFVDPFGYGVITECIINSHYPLPDSWVDFGFNWDFKEEQWINVLKGQKFTKKKCFNDLTFLTPDASYEIELHSYEGRIYEITCSFKSEVSLSTHTPTCNKDTCRLNLRFKELTIHPLGVFTDYKSVTSRDFNDYMLQKSWKWGKYKHNDNDEYEISCPPIRVDNLRLSECIVSFSQDGRFEHISYSFSLLRKHFYLEEWEDIKKEILVSFSEGMNLIGIDFFGGCYRSVDDMLDENKFQMNIIDYTYYIEFEEEKDEYTIRFSVYT